MSLETRREIIGFLVIMTEREQQEMLQKAKEIYARRETRLKCL